VRYSVLVRGKARKALRALPEAIRDRIAAAIDRLAADPRDGDVQKLHGQHEGESRLRVGDYRAILVISHSEMTIRVVDVGPRGGIY